MTSTKAAALVAAFIGGAACALASPASDAVLAEAKAACTQQGGSLATDKDAVKEIDLTGDGEAEQIVDFNYVDCSTQPVNCNTGGCDVFAVTAGKAVNLGTVVDWKLADWDNKKVLILQISGMGCGGDKLDFCLQAVVWDGKSFATIPLPASTP